MVTKLEVLKEMQNMYWHNVLCYSQNYIMTIPKEGCEEKWEKAREKAEFIDEWIEEEYEENN